MSTESIVTQIVSQYKRPSSDKRIIKQVNPIT